MIFALFYSPDFATPHRWQAYILLSICDSQIIIIHQLLLKFRLYPLAELIVTPSLFQFYEEPN